MTRFQLEHVIRAAAASANVREIVVIGSQAILGSFPHPPERLQQSMDADVYPHSPRFIGVKSEVIRNRFWPRFRNSRARYRRGAR